MGFDSQQRLFVLDTLNHRVQRFENLGLCLEDFPDYDPVDSETFPGCKLPPGNACSLIWQVGDPMIQDNPSVLTVRAEAGMDQVFVAETDLHQVVRYDTDGGSRTVLADGPGFGPGQVDTPVGVALGPNGQLFVADYNNNRLLILNTDGVYQREIAGAVINNINEFSFPYTPTVLETGEYYVVDESRIRVLRFDSDDNLTAKWTSAGDTPGRFWQPQGIAVGTDTDQVSKLFVADELNDRIQVFTLDGNLDRVISQFLGFGGSPFPFVAPTAILVDNGFIYLEAPASAPSATPRPPRK